MLQNLVFIYLMIMSSLADSLVLTNNPSSLFLGDVKLQS